MASAANSDLLTVEPSELTFPFRLHKQVSYTMKLINSSKSYCAFKVKTTSPKKYSVRPNTGVLQPRSTLEITVTMQAQHSMPADKQCKDKFLVQSVAAPEGFTANDISQEMFTKESGNEIFETRLKVALEFPEEEDPKPTSNGDVSSDGDVSTGSSLQQSLNSPSAILRDDLQGKDIGSLKAKIQEVNAALTTVLEERNAAVVLSQRLQQELSTLAANRKRLDTRQTGFSFLIVFLVGLLGVIVGFLISS